MSDDPFAAIADVKAALATAPTGFDAFGATLQDYWRILGRIAQAVDSFEDRA